MSEGTQAEVRFRRSLTLPANDQGAQGDRTLVEYFFDRPVRLVTSAATKTKATRARTNH